MAVQINPTGTGRVLPMGKLPPAPPHRVTVYAPDGTAVEVFQVDATDLCARGYSRQQPSSPSKIFEPMPATAETERLDARPKRKS